MNQPFQLPVQLRWADFDPNVHLRHSVYYDLGATARVEFLAQHGITFDYFEKHAIGPVLLREEAVFRREIRYGDRLVITTALAKLRRDFSRFSFQHELIREDGTLCAVMSIDGGWLDLTKRKLTPPPQAIAEMSEQAPKTAGFVWED